MQAVSQMSLDRFRIRRAVPADHDAIRDIWLRAVRVPHEFRGRGSVLSSFELWVLCPRWSGPVGFMGLSGASVEALFIAPEWIGLGGGSRLLNHARAMKGRLRVELSERNPGAARFYLACGFEVVDRFDMDGDGGGPSPMVRMRQAV
jgi:putative acetyltransferase